MKGPCCAICKVGSINCDGNGWNPFKNLLTCFWITSTASSTTAAPRYVSEWWKPSTATSKPFLEGAVVTRISAIYCSRPNAWRSPRPNSSFFRKPPKMRVSTNSCAEPFFVSVHSKESCAESVPFSQRRTPKRIGRSGGKPKCQLWRRNKRDELGHTSSLRGGRRNTYVTKYRLPSPSSAGQSECLDPRQVDEFSE